MIRKTWIFCLLAFAVYHPALAQSVSALSWPAITTTCKPWTRWWWLGNAVDTPGLYHQLDALQKAGFGGVEITPIYGTRGYENQFIDYLSPRWMQMLSYTMTAAKQLGLFVDMATGTGWPFGGPHITYKNAASKVFFQTYVLQTGERLKSPIALSDEQQKGIAGLPLVMAYSDRGEKINLSTQVGPDGQLNWKAPVGNWKLIAVFNGKTLQKVKRASPGGEGWVMDHFSSSALHTYLNKFTRAFATTKTPAPHAFFNDSYEVYGADWSENLLSEFAKRRGYHLEDYLPQLLGEGSQDSISRVRADYRETVAEMLLEHFTIPWTAWAHQMGSITRNQAHGSPGNLIDLYAAVDIPECESFGTTVFNIPGIDFDTVWMRSSDSHQLILKFASSAAHITGKKYVSSETFTWLREHFMTSLSQCKPELDQLFLSGVNHVFFHGTPYSPKTAPWPGWQFYASVNFSPYNTFWHDIPAFTAYIARCQSFLQWGRPDNDLLVYWPVQDSWHQQQGHLLYPFEIGQMPEWLAPTSFYRVCEKMIEKGYGLDFISDRYLLQTRVQNRLLKTPGATYKALVIPACTFVPEKTMKAILALAKNGAKIIFVDHLPREVPGFHHLQQRRKIFDRLLQKIPFPSVFSANKQQVFGKGQLIAGRDPNALLAICKIPRESLVDQGLRYIRRKNEEGYHYFLSNLQAKGVDGWVALSVNATSAVIFDPYTGTSGIAQIRKAGTHTEVYLQLKPGQSLVLKTYSDRLVSGASWSYYQAQGPPSELTGRWTLSFVQGAPAIQQNFTFDRLQSWTQLSDSSRVFAGTGKYATVFQLPSLRADNWLLSLGRIDASARVSINGQEVGILWGVPFQVAIGKFLQPGKNLLEVAVTNLPANRIADYDRRGTPWKIFYDINFVNIHYQPFDASAWKPVPSGLTGPVLLIPLKKMKF